MFSRRPSLQPAVLRLIPFALAGALALAACSNSDGAETPAATPIQAQTPVAAEIMPTEAVATPSPTPTEVPPTPSPEPTPTPALAARVVGSGTRVVLDALANTFVVEETELKLQFLEVFDGARCPDRGTCTALGAGTALIGLSGPGIFPFIVELYLGTQLYGLSGYDMRLDSIDRGPEGDTVVVALAPAGEGLAGGVLATFNVGEETFRVWITNPVTADRVVALSEGALSGVFPSGPILPGPGVNNHNQPRRWHLDPSLVELTNTGGPACDAPPSVVDGAREQWLDLIGTYCPGSAELVEVRDLR